MILTLRFIVLFALCWLCFFAVPRRWRPWTLAFWGAVFYAMFAGAFLAIVLVLTILAYLAGRRAMAWTAGALVVALLYYFKVRAAVSDLGAGAPASATILMPLGFSYLSFELLHVLIERRRGRIRELSFPDLLAFVFFAPARVAGPIKRYPDFTAAVRGATLSMANVYAGTLRVLTGLAKKLFVADVLALTVAERPEVRSVGHAWVVLLAFTFQIYFDFSAYTDVALGFSRTLGISLPENFRRPYLAPNIREFWNRWHITLSTWVRDYIFLPTGRGLFRTRLRAAPTMIAAISYLLTFLAVGAWHGVTAAFLLWGLYHGLLLAGYHAIRARTPVRVAAHPLYHSRIVTACGVVVTFLLVAIGWVPFMTNLQDASTLLASLFGVGVAR
jgi:alginate O-acetyltransferase complex protein AlgI